MAAMPMVTPRVASLACPSEGVSAPSRGGSERSSPYLSRPFPTRSVLATAAPSIRSCHARRSALPRATRLFPLPRQEVEVAYTRTYPSQTIMATTGARKRTKGASVAATSSSSAKTTIGKPAAKEIRSSARLLFKVFFGLASLACFVLVALSFLSPREAYDVEFLADPLHTTSPRPSDAATAEESKAPTPDGFIPDVPFSMPPRPPPTTVVRTADADKQAAIKEAFRDSWHAYVEDAFGADEYHPISRSGTNFSVSGGVGYFIIDTLDVLLLMGEGEEYSRARDWVRTVDWSSRSGKFSVFEVSCADGEQVPTAAHHFFSVLPRADDDSHFGRAIECPCAVSGRRGHAVTTNVAAVCARRLSHVPPKGSRVGRATASGF